MSSGQMYLYTASSYASAESLQQQRWNSLFILLLRVALVHFVVQNDIIFAYNRGTPNKLGVSVA